MIEIRDVSQTNWNSNFGFIRENVTIKTGEIVGILGENGSGKTTLFKTLMGLSEILRGDIRFDGKPVSEMYDQIAFITEEGSYLSHMTPEEYALFLADFFPHFNLERYYKLLEFFKILPHFKIKSFSRGEKSKVEIAAGFSKGAKFILMDEPFLGKDLFTRRDFLKLMISSLRKDETVLIATHMIDEIEHVIDRALILKRGRVKADVYIEDLREQGRTIAELMAEIAKYKEDEYKQIFED